ncbi:uncharacterized protein LOC143037578 [Oratosquilla oratoria]|uniref:uncharacterized protein LOC143037578 n=1 Tax=Oratosquilla oratoria TaxID=337810 RepID=UPI003F758044
MHMPEDIPEELASSVTAGASFLLPTTSLQRLHGEDHFDHHQIIATEKNYLIELKNGAIIKSTVLPIKNIVKVFINQDFIQEEVFIALLSSTGEACLLSHPDFKVLQEWNDVKDILYDDSNIEGPVKITVKYNNGQEEVPKLLHQTMEIEEHLGQQHATAALTKQLQNGLHHLQNLKEERRKKEAYIVSKIASMRLSLQGVECQLDNSLMPAVGVGCKDSSLQTLKEPVLKIFSTRQRLVHNKWVIAVEILNDSNSFSIHDLDLALHVIKGCHTLNYHTLVLKTIQKKKSDSLTPGPASSTQWKISVEQLKPNVLIPKKRAFVFGVCDIPTFSDGPAVSCSGLVLYHKKALSKVRKRASCDQQLTEKPPTKLQEQTLIPPIEMLATDMQSLRVTSDQISNQGGVSFSTVAIIAASRVYAVKVNSLVSPLSNFVKFILRPLSLVKVSGVTDMYCNSSNGDHPLQHVAMIIDQQGAHEINLRIYARDDSQAILLVHALLSCLPKDTIIKPLEDGEEEYRNQDLLQMKLLGKIREGLEYMRDGFQGQLETKKIKDDDIIEIVSKEKHSEYTEIFDQEKAKFERKSVTLNEELYATWKERLNVIQKQVDEMYAHYMNCSSK